MKLACTNQMHVSLINGIRLAYIIYILYYIYNFIDRVGKGGGRGYVSILVKISLNGTRSNGYSTREWSKRTMFNFFDHELSVFDSHVHDRQVEAGGGGH